MDHPGQLCRLCAQPCTFAEIRFLFNDEEQVMKSVDGDNDEFSGLDLVELINLSLPVKVSRTDHLPKQVCFQCIEKVKASCEFAAGCLAAEQELEKLVDENKFKSETAHSKKEKNLKPMLTDSELEAALEDTNIVGTKDVEANVDYCCPLCCEGLMAQSADSPITEKIDDQQGDDDDIVSGSDSEESIQHMLLDNIDDNFVSKNEEGEENEDEEELEDDMDLNVGENKTGTTTAEDTVFIDDETDQDYLDPYDKKRKYSGEFRGKTRGRGKGRKRGRPRGTDFSSMSRKNPEDDTLMWVGEESHQSVPLVQCVRCSGWLPGFAACLQHTLSSHVTTDDGEKKTAACSRCEVPPFESEKELVDHFLEKHCADLEVGQMDDGAFTVADKSVKGNSDGRRFRNVAYHCSICEKGFSWLLNFLRHSCLPLENEKMYCQECEVSFSNRQRFVFHKQFHGPNAPSLECDVCGESYESDSLLYDHARFAHLDENIVCDECGKHFRSEKGLHYHQQNAHNLNPESLSRHKCPECGKGYRDKQGLREHMVTHLSVKPFPCNKCDRAYNRYSRLKQHQLTHVYSDSMNCFECNTCGMAFPTEESALQHAQFDGHVVQGVTLTKVYRCEFCDSLFSRAEGLNQHRPIHDGMEKPYVCHICGAAFSSYSRVTTHKTTHGVYDQVEPHENDFSIPKHFLCEHCGLSYLYWGYLRTHRKTRHSDDPYIITCKLCPEKFRNSWSALYHRKKVHEGGAAKEWRKKSLSCSVCGNHYMYQHTLDIHMEKKHGPYKDGNRESYQCEACGKVFKYQSSLVLHQKMHLGQKGFLCEDCNKGFQTVATWRNHVKRCHEGIRPHKCDYCNKTFFHKVSRDDHQRVHTGEKPFECEHCQKCFRLKSMLTDHAKIHNDDRPYPCDVCGTSFRRMVHMKQHRMLHTGERPYECPMCHQDFRLKQELRRHLKSKHAEPPLPQDDDFILLEEQTY